MMWGEIKKGEAVISIDCYVKVKGIHKAGKKTFGYTRIPVAFKIDEFDYPFGIRNFEKLKEQIVKQAVKELRKEIRKSKKVKKCSK